MKTFRYVPCAVVFLCALLFCGCPEQQPQGVIGTSGTLRLSDPIKNTGYKVISVHIYTRQGRELMSMVPIPTYKDSSGSGTNPVTPIPGVPGITQPTEGEVDYWTWEMSVEAYEGLPVTFWTEFLDDRTGTKYFSEGEEDVVVSGNRYDFIARALYTPIFNETDLRSIGNTTHFASTHNFVLVRDITLTAPWTPLCTTTEFRGIFDGNNHVIRNFKFVANLGHDAGFFGSVAGTIAKHAGIKDLTIELAPEAVELNLGGTAVQNAGILAGVAAYADIDKITVRGAVRGEAPPAVSMKKSGGNVLCAGGLVGALLGESVLSRSSYQLPLVTEIEYAGGGLTVYLGGIVGKVGDYKESTTTIRKCYASYDISLAVTGTAANSQGCFSYVGGVAGGGVDSRPDTQVVIDESYFAGSIGVLNAWSGGVGGIVGGNILQLFNTGAGAENSTSLGLNKVAFTGQNIDADFKDNTPGTESYGLNIISGQKKKPELGSEPNLSLTPLNFGKMHATAVTKSTNSEIVRARDEIKASWFSNSSGYGGLGWDFNATWIWSDARMMPVFRWE